MNTRSIGLAPSVFRGVVMMGVAAAIGLAAAGGAAKAAPAPGATPDPLKVLAAVDSLAVRKTWPGFDPATVPLAIGTAQATWLYHHPAPPMDFQESSARPGLWTHPGLHDSIRANSSAMIEGVRTATILLEAPESAGSARDVAGTAIHEMFHVWTADRHPEWNANEFDRFLYPAADTSLLVARRLEAQALGRALTAPAGSTGAAEAAGWAARASLEHHRAEAAMPPAAARYADMLEVKEGLADYVRLKTLGKRPDRGLLPPDDFLPEAVRDRACAVGCGWAFVLDRLDNGWVARFDTTQAVTSLAAFADSMLAPRGIAARDFDRRDAATARDAALRAAEGITSRRASARESFFARPGWRLVFVTANGDPFWVNKLDPVNMTPLAGTEVLHRRWIKVSNLSLGLEARDVPVLTEGIEGQPLMAGVRQVTLAGLTDKPEVAPGEKETVITGSGFVAHLPNGRYVVQENGNEIKVQVTGAPPRAGGRRRG